MSWIITNKILIRETFNLLAEGGNYHFYADNKSINNYKKFSDGIIIFIEGYILPRSKYFAKYKTYNQFDLVHKLYKEKGIECLKRLKGLFNLIIADGYNIIIANDQTGVRKYFYKFSDKEYFITDGLSNFDKIDFAVDEIEMIMFSLMEHNIDGKTLFKRICFPNPGMYIKINGEIKTETYFDYNEIYNQEYEDIGLADFSLKFSKIIDDYIAFLKPKEVKLTLTGGNDSRMILSALINNNVNVKLFSYGDKSSYDCVVAKKISEKLLLNYTNHNAVNDSTDWFQDNANEVLKNGNSLVNLHRAHRNYTANKESSDSMLFTGLMGGDYVRGINLDDYITPKIFRLWNYSNLNKTEIIKNIGLEKRMIINNDLADRIINRLESFLPFMGGDLKKKEFFLNTHFVGPVHDSQDTTVYLNKFSFVVNIFMDIDFLELLFSTKHNMIHKEHTSNNFFKRIKDAELACNVISILCPELGSVEFSKQYSPSEYLGNRLIYIGKRISRNYFGKKYPQNFPLGDWMEKYTKDSFVNLNDSLFGVFEIEKLRNELFSESHSTVEKYWHKFTNPINISRNIDLFAR